VATRSSSPATSASRTIAARWSSAQTVEAFGHLDFAHNNAGIELQDTICGTNEADFDRVIAVNLKGVWLGMKHQIPRMLQDGGGSIVNTASLAGLIAVPSLAAYIASKHGVVGLTRAAAVEHANDGVRVNCVCPAAIRTAMMDILSEERQRELLAPQAMTRFGEPSEVAESVVWLVSDRSSFVTGTALSVDAGAMACG
jgi:NAD(P)-dependent dehydrogenase (short-subunit alcohol dehydrogenase family)